jgi:hypothetical protein
MQCRIRGARATCRGLACGNPVLMAVDRPISPIRPRLTRAFGRAADVLPFLLFCGGYAGLIAWFKYVDVYQTHFSATGPIILLHNLFRVLFIFYLFWMVQAVGAVLLRFVGGLNRKDLATLDYLALTFFAGAGPWHVVLLALGYASLLTGPVMIILTVPAVALSFREARVAGPELRALLAGRLAPASKHFKAACILLCLVWCALLLVKGLYPGNAHEYYAPYHYLYQSFLEHSGSPDYFSWGNFVRGAGLFFLGILLTDPLAPQLVTFCLLSAAGLATFLFIRRLAPRTVWSMAGVTLFFGLFIYTPAWGDFRKLHELNTSFVIAILWMTVIALDDRVATTRAWLAAAASAVTAAIIINTYSGGFLGAVFGSSALAYFLMRDHRRGFVCLAFTGLVAVLVAGTFVVNFITSGLLNGQGLVYFWRFSDIEKLHRLNALPSVLIMHLGMVRDAALGAKLSAFGLLIRALRLELLWPLFLGGLLLAGTSVYERRRSREAIAASRPVLMVFVAFAVFCALGLIVGRTDPGAFFRFSSFMVPVTIVAGIIMWTAPLRDKAVSQLGAMVRHPAALFVVLALCAAMVMGKTRLDRNVVKLGAHALEYAAGIISIDDTYRYRSVGNLSVPWGGIYPGARGAYAIVGPGTPIWSMNAYTFCLLPDCKMMSSYSVLMRDWDRLMWGTAEEGRNALHAAGLNYFLFSRELPVTDPIVRSPLFSPDDIGRYLGIRWTDGTTTLLTWAGPDTTSPDEAWLADYRSALAAGHSRRVRFPNAEMKAIFERLRATPHPWRPFPLPWERH